MWLRLFYHCATSSASSHSSRYSWHQTAKIAQHHGHYSLPARSNKSIQSFSLMLSTSSFSVHASRSSSVVRKSNILANTDGKSLPAEICSSRDSSSLVAEERSSLKTSSRRNWPTVLEQLLDAQRKAFILDDETFIEELFHVSWRHIRTSILKPFAETERCKASKKGKLAANSVKSYYTTYFKGIIEELLDPTVSCLRCLSFSFSCSLIAFILSVYITVGTRESATPITEKDGMCELTSFSRFSQKDDACRCIAIGL